MKHAMKSKPVFRGIITIICSTALCANAIAVQMHMLCSSDADQIIAEDTIIGNDLHEHEHHCSHTAHHEPVTETRDNDHCTPCVNDFFDIPGKIRPDREFQLSCTVPVPLRPLQQQEEPVSLLSDSFSPSQSVFPPQYPPLKTVIRS